MPITSSFSGASARALGLTSSGYTAIGNGYWINKTSKSSQNISAGAHSLAVDSSGNTYYAGYSNAYPSGTDYSQNLVKYNSAGAIVWQRKLDTSGVNDISYTVSVDTSGNVYILGFGNSNTYGTYIKYNSSGTLQWQKRLSDSFIYVLIYGSVIDSSGNLYIAGQTYNNSTNTYDGVVVKLDSSGAITWQRRLYTNNTDGFLGIALDSSNNVYVCGFTVTSTTPTTQRKGLILKLNSSGALQWQREITSLYDVYTESIVCDSAGAVYVSSLFRDSNGGTVFGSVVKYSSSGTLQWQTKTTYSAYGIGTTPTNTQSLDVDSSNNIYVISYSSSYVTSGGTVLGSPLLIQKFNSSGTEQWARNFNFNGPNQIGLAATSIKINGNTMYFLSLLGIIETVIVIAALPTDGSKTGNYSVGNTNITYNAVSTTVTSGTLTDASGGLNDTAGALTSSTATLTDSANDLTVTVRD
jgi:hypothetical protein